MPTIQEKTQGAVQTLVDTLELRSAVRHPLTNKEPDGKTGKWKVVKYTGDIEETAEFRIDINKFQDENIYPDEVDGIMAKVSSKCGFTYYIIYPTPIFNGLVQLVLKKPNNISWAKVIKNLKNYKDSGDKEVSKIKVYLEKNGNLWREPKEKFIYQMGEDSNRHKIVRYLALRKSYQKTYSLADNLRVDKRIMRSEIGKIRSNIKKYLKLNGSEVIESKRGSGYRIPNIKVN